jgi:hypothetical protein
MVLKLAIEVAVRGPLARDLDHRAVENGIQYLHPTDP